MRTSCFLVYSNGTFRYRSILREASRMSLWKVVPGNHSGRNRTDEA